MAASPMIVPSNKEPTFWNKDAAVGLMLFFIPGMIIGGFIGKNRMEREQVQGKIVSEPTAWNKSAVIGYGLGSYIGTALMIAIAVAGAPVPTAAISTFSMISAIVGGIIGGSHGKAQMEQEYAEAKAYVAQYGNYSPNQQQSLAQEKQLESSYKNTVTPEEAKLLEERLAAAKERPRDPGQALAVSGASR